MTIQDLGSLGEIIGAVATVATLAYLAVQLRQNTATVRTSAAALHTQAENTLNTLMVQDPEVNKLFWVGLESPESLEEHDRRRFESLIGIVAKNMEQSWKFSNDGVIDGETWQGERTSIAWFARKPGFALWWSLFGDLMHPGFGKLMSELLSAEHESGPTTESAAQQSAAADSA